MGLKKENDVTKDQFVALTKQFGSLVSIAVLLAKKVYCVTSLALNRAVTCQQLIGDRKHTLNIVANFHVWRHVFSQWSKSQ